MSDPGGPRVNPIPPKTAQKQRALLVGILFQDRHDEDKTLKCFEPYDAGEVGMRLQLGVYLSGRLSDQWREPCLIRFVFAVRPRAKQTDCVKDNAAPGPQICPLLEHRIIVHGLLEP